MFAKRLVKVLTLSLLLFAAISCNGQQTPHSQPPAMPANNAPVITDLKAERQVQQAATIQVVCQASDPESENLTYKWTASGGIINGSGSTINWTAPEKGGDFDIQVTVSDSLGATATKDVIVNVPEKPNNPPSISAIKFTRQGHMPVTVKPNMTPEEKVKTQDLVIKVYDTASISCLASDPDGDKLDYIWMTSGGSIKGTGPTVQWIAPGAGGTYTVTCEVSDLKEGTDTLTLTITVKCCGV